MPKQRAKRKLKDLAPEEEARRAEKTRRIAEREQASAASVDVCSSRWFSRLARYMIIIQGVDGDVRKKGLDGEGTEGVYGSVSFGSQLAMTSSLLAHGELLQPHAARDKQVMVDFGAGTGRALALWTMLGLVDEAVGYECDRAKWEKSREYLRRLINTVHYDKDVPVCTRPPVVHMRAIEQVDVAELTLLRATHGYSFMAGMAPSALRAMGRLFLETQTMKVLVLVSQICNRGELLEALGIGAERVATRRLAGAVAMGGRKFKVRVLRKC